MRRWPGLAALVLLHAGCTSLTAGQQAHLDDWRRFADRVTEHYGVADVTFLVGEQPGAGGGAMRPGGLMTFQTRMLEPLPAGQTRGFGLPRLRGHARRLPLVARAPVGRPRGAARRDAGRAAPPPLSGRPIRVLRPASHTLPDLLDELAARQPEHELIVDATGRVRLGYAETRAPARRPAPRLVRLGGRRAARGARPRTTPPQGRLIALPAPPP